MNAASRAGDGRRILWRRMLKLGHWIGQGLERFEIWALCIGVGGLALLLVANVVARTFFKSLYYAEEISEFLVIFTTFVGVSYAVRRARHIRMGAIFDALPYRAQKTMIFVISAVSGGVMFVMAGIAFRYLTHARIQGHLTPALRIPYWLFLVIVPLSFISAGLQYVRTIIKNISEHAVWLSPEQQGEYEVEG